MLLQMKMSIEFWTMNMMFTKWVNYEGISSGNLWVVVVLIDLRVREVVRIGK
jgi:hypothetical protein